MVECGFHIHVHHEVALISLLKRMKPVAIDMFINSGMAGNIRCCNCVIYIHTNQFDYETSLCYLQVNYYETIKSFIELIRLKKPIGFMLLFWPCAWGLTLAYDFSKDTLIIIFFS